MTATNLLVQCESGNQWKDGLSMPAITIMRSSISLNENDFEREFTPDAMAKFRAFFKGIKVSEASLTLIRDYLGYLEELSFRVFTQTLKFTDLGLGQRQKSSGYRILDF